MPSKIQQDENLYFLLACLQNSDLKLIDFAAVAARTNIKAPAARMRYTRLKKQIEANPPLAMSVEKGAKNESVLRRESLRGNVQQGKRQREDGFEEEDERKRRHLGLYHGQIAGHRQPDCLTLPAEHRVPTFDRNFYPHPRYKNAPRDLFEVPARFAQSKRAQIDHVTFPQMYKRDTNIKTEIGPRTKHIPEQAAVTLSKEENTSSSEDEMPLAKLRHKKPSTPCVTTAVASTPNEHISPHSQLHPSSKPPCVNTAFYSLQQELHQLHGNFPSRERPESLFRNPNPFGSSDTPPVHMASRTHLHALRGDEGREPTHPIVPGSSGFRFTSQS